MANPPLPRFSVPLLLLHLFLLSLIVNIVSSADSPVPAPNSSPDSPTPSPTHVSPNPSPANSPQAPTPAISPHPDSPPAPSPETSPSPSPSPAEADNSGVNHAGVGDIESKSSSGGGMSSGKKAGIAVGVIVAVGAFALGALVYKKRRQNIQRTEYGYAARRELL